MGNFVSKKFTTFDWTTLSNWVHISYSGFVIDGKGDLYHDIFSKGLHLDTSSTSYQEVMKGASSFQCWLPVKGTEKLFHFQLICRNEEEAVYTVAELSYENIVNKYTLQSLEASDEVHDDNEKELQHSAYWDEIKILKSQIRTLLNSAPEAILLLDFEKLTYVVANAKAEELFGLPEKELINRHFGQLSPEKQAGGGESVTLSHKFLAQAAEGKEVRFEWQIKHSAGHIIPVEVRVVRIPDPRRILLRSSIIDISDRKRYERILRESEAKYRNLFDLHRTPMMFHDFSTGIRHINGSFQELMGLPPEQHNIPDFEAFIHPDDLLEYRRHREELLHGQYDNYLMEMRCVRTNQQTRCISMSVSAIRNEEGKVIATLRMLDDITQQKQAQEEIKQRNLALEKMNRELDAFVYTVAHDIRAPLASLKGLIQLIKGEKDPTTIESYGKLQEVCVNRLDSFIQEIADYSRNKKSALKIEEIDVDQMIREVFDQHKYMIHERGKVHFELKACSHRKLFSDPGRLGIVLNNLISNAIRYSDDSKARKFVRIEVQDVGEDAIEIKIIDNGIGIAQEHLERIFEMFYRISNNIEGTGMGLYIVKETVEKIQGKILVDSVQGKGTTFVLELKNLQPKIHT